MHFSEARSSEPAAPWAALTTGQAAVVAKHSCRDCAALTVTCGMCRPGKALMSEVHVLGNQQMPFLPCAHSWECEAGWHCRENSCHSCLEEAWSSAVLLSLLPQLPQPRHSAHSALRCAVRRCGQRGLSSHKSPPPYSQPGPAVCSLGICYKSGIQR